MHLFSCYKQLVLTVCVIVGLCLLSVCVSCRSVCTLSVFVCCLSVSVCVSSWYALSIKIVHQNHTCALVLVLVFGIGDWYWLTWYWLTGILVKTIYKSTSGSKLSTFYWIKIMTLTFYKVQEWTTDPNLTKKNS